MLYFLTFSKYRSSKLTIFLLLYSVSSLSALKQEINTWKAGLHLLETRLICNSELLLCTTSAAKT